MWKYVFRGWLPSGLATQCKAKTNFHFSCLEFCHIQYFYFAKSHQEKWKLVLALHCSQPFLQSLQCKWFVTERARDTIWRQTNIKVWEMWSDQSEALIYRNANNRLEWSSGSQLHPTGKKLDKKLSDEKTRRTALTNNLLIWRWPQAEQVQGDKKESTTDFDNLSLVLDANYLAHMD